MLGKTSKFLHFFIFSIILISFSTFLIKNQNRFPIPNTDLFQYIGDGYQYINFKLPESIHPPPLAPILICLGADLFRNFSEYPELTSVHTIIILCSIGSLINIFLIVKKYSPLSALIVTSLIATNQIYINNSLNVTNEIIYGFFLTLVLLLYQKKPIWPIYLLSGLLFLIRYESVVLPLAIFIIEYFFNRKQLKLKNIFIAFLPIILWLIVLNYHSTGSSILENAYIKEISNAYQEIPNLRAIISLPLKIFFNGYQNLYILNFFILLLLIFEIISPKTHKIIKIAFLVLIFHTLFLLLFPNYYPRYHMPVIWIIYLLLINRQNKFIKIMIFLILITYNSIQSQKPYNFDLSNNHAEYRLSANWLNKQQFQHPVVVYIYDPGIISYYIYNPKVFLNYNSYEDNSNLFCLCKDRIVCAIEKQYKKYQNTRLNCDHLSANKMVSQIPFEIYVITTTNSSIPLEKIDDQYTAYRHHLLSFQKIRFFNEPSNFKLITVLGNTSNWAKIYKYIP